MTPTEAILLFLAGRSDGADEVARIRSAAADPEHFPEEAKQLEAFRKTAAGLLSRPKVTAAARQRLEESQAAFHTAVSRLSPEAAALLPPPSETKRADPYFARLVEYLAERYSDQPPPDRSSEETLASSVFSTYLTASRSAPHLDDPQDPWGLLLEISARKVAAGADDGPDEFVRVIRPAYIAECRALLAATDADQRAIVAGRLAGRTVDQLTQITGRAEPVVKAALKSAHNWLRRTYEAAS